MKGQGWRRREFLSQFMRELLLGQGLLLLVRVVVMLLLLMRMLLLLVLRVCLCSRRSHMGGGGLVREKPKRRGRVHIGGLSLVCRINWARPGGRGGRVCFFRLVREKKSN